MKQKGKISSRKVARFAFGSLVLIAFAWLLLAANKKQSEQPIAGVIVSMKNDERAQNFLLKKDVEQLLLTNQQIEIEHQTIASLDLNKIEQLALSNPWVQAAEVFVDNNSKLNIEVTQRIPIARIFDAQGNSFYIDSSGFEMPLSSRYAYAVPVFTNYKVVTDSSTNEAQKRQMIALSQVLSKDSFWNAQITQIDLAKPNDFNLYTTLGEQKIRLGDTSNLSNKLNDLLSFYKEVSNKIGWDRYKVLDVRFAGQVIASPSIGWIPPKDTVVVDEEEDVVKVVVDNKAAKPIVAVKTAEQVKKVAQPEPKAALKPVAKTIVKQTSLAKPKSKASEVSKANKPVNQAPKPKPKSTSGQVEKKK